MKVAEYKVQFLCNGNWVDADFDTFLGADSAKNRIEFYKKCDGNWKHRVVSRNVDCGEWEEVK